jgi:hypothetical protein
MKTIHLPALTQITFEDLGEFLSWLANQPTSSASLAQIRKTPPTRTSKLNPLIKTLDLFGFIDQKQGRISITGRGRDFLRSENSVRKAVARKLFGQVDWVQMTLEKLKASANGRLHRGVINDSFNSIYRSPIAESEVIAFISWAQLCELFGYDKKKEELIHVESIVPREPNPIVPNLRLVS